MILTYDELIDAKPLKCWTLYQLEDGRLPVNTNNDHSSLGGTSKRYGAVDTAYPRVPGENNAGEYSAPGQAGVVSPCWAYVAKTRDYSSTNTGALVWLNILLGKPPPVPLPGQSWDPGWEDVSTGWKMMLVHMSELYIAKRQVIPPGLLIGRLMDLKKGKPFVPHVHKELHPTALNKRARPGIYDPRPLYYDGLIAIKESWTWSKEHGLFIMGPDDSPEERGAQILHILDEARAEIAGLLPK